MKEIAVNRSATFEYFIEDRFEAGIQLCGTEVKSVKQGNISLKESFVWIREGEMWLKNCNISPYKEASIFNVPQKRDRKILMHKEEIAKLRNKVENKGYTLIVTKVYLKEALVKVEVALCKGKHTFDKKQSLKERDKLMDAKREMKEYR